MLGLNLNLNFNEISKHWNSNSDLQIAFARAPMTASNELFFFTLENFGRTRIYFFNENI